MNRVLGGAAEAPRLLEGNEHEIVDLTGVPGNDLANYAYELARLRNAAREVIRVFEPPAEAVRALGEFESAVPQLRRARNPLTHPSDDPRLDDVAWFSALVRLHDHGSVQYLVDPRHHHHEAAAVLAESPPVISARRTQDVAPGESFSRCRARTPLVD